MEFSVFNVLFSEVVHTVDKILQHVQEYSGVATASSSLVQEMKHQKSQINVKKKPQRFP